MSRNLICKSNLPKSLWIDAINITNYVFNRRLIRPILKKTSYELLKDKKPNVSYFKTFGSKCFIHSNGKKNLDKFDTRSDEDMFVDYSFVSKVYRVYNKHTKVIEEPIHIIFDKINNDLTSTFSFGEFKLSNIQMVKMKKPKINAIIKILLIRVINY